MKKKEDFRDIEAYHVGAILQVTDWFTVLPVLQWFRKRTTDSLTLDYLGDREAIEKDIAKGACFLSNHRDICMDAGWLSLLLRCRYNIRPFIGMGNNLFGKWWIEGLARFNRIYVVKRGVRPHELIEKSKHLSRYIRSLRQEEKSIWLAQREGRAKDSNDRTQGSVLKMLTMAAMDEGKSFFEAIKEMNICPVSLSYEYDPCDYLKAEEMQLKRDNPRWRKRPGDDLKSMQTGIEGYKGRVIFRLTRSINDEVDQLLAERPEVKTAAINDQAQLVCDIIDRHIWQGYEIFHRDLSEIESYIQTQIARSELPNKDEQFMHDRIVEMYRYPILNKDGVAPSKKMA